MSGLLITCLVLAAVAVLAGIGAALTSSAGGKGLAAIAGVLSVLFLFLASFDTIETRHVGVLVAFGKASDKPLKNGFHWHNPAYTVHEFDATLQPQNFTEDVTKDGCQGITVRLGNGTTACTDVTLQWNIDGDGNVPELYRQYQSFERINDNLVHQQLRVALNNAFGTFDPFAALKAAADAQLAAADPKAPKPADVVTLGEVSDGARAALQKAVGTGIKVDVLTIPLVHYDQPTESRLSAFQQSIADTRIAEQQKQTNIAIHNANDQLKAASSNDPGVLYQNCLTFLRDMASKNQLGSLPATFTCPGSNAAGALVTVPAK